MIGSDHLDLQSLFGGAEVFDRHAGRHDRSRAGDSGIEAGHIVHVADANEREILARRIRPGEPIGTEAQLVKQFGVNRSTVREGIRLLEQSGLIHRDSGRRLTASLPHYSRLATRMSRAMLLHEVTFRELWEATTALEIATVE